MVIPLLTQKYTNDVQKNSQKHFGYLTERMYSYRDRYLIKSLILMPNVPYLLQKPIKNIKKNQMSLRGLTCLKTF